MHTTINRNRFSAFTLYGLIFSLLVSLAACQVRNPTGDPTDQATAAIASPTLTAQATSTIKASDTPAPTQPPAHQLEVEPSALEGVTIDFWHTWTGEAGEALSKLTKDFNASNEWGVQVQEVYQGNYDQIFRKVDAAIQEGSTPDLATAFTYQALAWEKAQGKGPGGLIVDLNEYVDDPIWGLTADEQADFYPPFWEQDLLDGVRRGIPAERSAQALYYNQTWAKELGFDNPPSSLEEFSQQACAAAEANRQDDLSDNDTTGGLIVTTDYSAVTGWIYAFGGEITPSGGSGYRFDTPEVEQAFNYMRELYDQGCAWIPESDPPETEFANRSGLFTSGSVTGIPHQSLVFERLGSRDEWTVLPFPSPQGEPAISVYGPSFEILKSEPERQLAAWLFLKWLTLPENQAQLAQASGSFPTRRSSQEHLDDFAGSNPQWAAAQDLIQYAHPEPAFQSWSTVRWAVSDAATQLFRYYFTIDQVPSLVKLLEETAEELDARE